MNILLLTIGSHGDVHPFVGLGLTLQQRGHRVTVITSGYFRELIEKAGLKFDGIGTPDEFIEMASQPDLWHPRKGMKTILENIGQLHRRVYDKIAQHHVPGQTVMAASSLCVSALTAREMFKIPTATIHLSPAIMRSVHETPVLQGFPHGKRVPKFIKRGAYWVADRIIDRMGAKPLNQLRKEIGLPATRCVFGTGLNSPDRLIGLWPQWFAPVQPDWPPQTRLTGFPLWDEAGVTGVSNELKSFLDEGDAPIIFTPGSAMMHGESFFRESAKACEILNRRGILLTRHAQQIPSNLPPRVRHFDYAPFRQILPRAAAFVHHGGIGSTAQGFAAGIPQLIMKLSHDQFDNAARAERLGVAHSLLPKQYTADRVASELNDLMTSPKIALNTKRIACHFQSLPLEQTSDLIEQLRFQS